MSDSFSMDKEMLDELLKQLGKRYRKIAGKYPPVEITVVGGASVIIDYDFRRATADIDAVVMAKSAMKDAINDVGNENGLPRNWLNDDFKKTDSYTPRLQTFSKHYRTFSNVLEVRYITGEYLIAMKLKAGRTYKHDLSDIVGILKEEHERRNTISWDMVTQAVNDLYDGWDNIPKGSKMFFEAIISIPPSRYGVYIAEIRKREQKAREEAFAVGKKITEDEKNMIPATEQMPAVDGSNEKIWVRPHVRNGKSVKGHWRKSKKGKI